ncbi:MAG: hypothetical protein HYY62_06990 [Deltaproteobacteria bacterium]|nr:hypothetical protein [Deltaproteobacteria bacterium]
MMRKGCLVLVLILSLSFVDCGKKRGGRGLSPITAVPGSFNIILSGFQDGASGASILASSIGQVSVAEKPIYRVPNRVHILFVSTKALKAETVIPQNIILMEAATQKEIDRRIVLGGSKKEFSLIPQKALDANIIYSVKLTEHLQDEGGNKLSESLEFQMKTGGELSQVQLAVTLPLLSNRTPQVVINEVVLDPKKDWNDDTAGGNGIPFDSVFGSSAADTGDQWIELYNATNQVLDISEWTVVDQKQNKVICQIGSGQCREIYNLGGNHISFMPGEFLVMGGWAEALPTNVELVLKDGSTVIDEIHISDGEASDENEEAIARKTTGISKEVDDFRKEKSTIGAAHAYVEVVEGTTVYLNVIGEDSEGYHVPVGQVSFENTSVISLGNNVYSLDVPRALVNLPVKISRLGKADLTTSATFQVEQGGISDFTLRPSHPSIEANGKNVSVIFSSPIKNQATGDPLSHETFMISASLGTLVDEGGQTITQVQTNSDGILEFRLKADSFRDSPDQTSTVSVTKGNLTKTTTVIFRPDSGSAQLQPGIATGTIRFLQSEYTVSGDQVTTVLVSADPNDLIKDASGNPIPNNTKFTISGSGGIEIIEDVDSDLDGNQVGSTNGSISFTIKSSSYVMEDVQGTLFVRSVVGSAYGQVKIHFTNPGLASAPIFRADNNCETDSSIDPQIPATGDFAGVPMGWLNHEFGGCKDGSYRYIPKAVRAAQERRLKDRVPVIVEVDAKVFDSTQNVHWPINCGSFHKCDSDLGKIKIEGMKAPPGTDSLPPLILRAKPGTSPAIGNSKYEVISINNSENIIIEGFDFIASRPHVRIQNSSNLTFQKNRFLGAGGINFGQWNGAWNIKIINNIFARGSGIYINQRQNSKILVAHNIFKTPQPFVINIVGGGQTVAPAQPLHTLLYIYNNIFYQNISKHEEDGIWFEGNQGIFTFQGPNDVSSFSLPLGYRFHADHNIYLLLPDNSGSPNLASYQKFGIPTYSPLYKVNNFNEWQTAINDQHSIIKESDSDMGFQDSTNLDFYIIDPQSPALNAGGNLITVNDEFFKVLFDFENHQRQNPPDIGPYEIQ